MTSATFLRTAIGSANGDPDEAGKAVRRERGKKLILLGDEPKQRKQRWQSLMHQGNLKIWGI